MSSGTMPNKIIASITKKGLTITMTDIIPVADNKTALTPEEKKAELARRQAALEARQAQAKREAKTRLESARKVSPS